MKKIKKVLMNLVFLVRYSWTISRRLFAASALSVVLNATEPFILLIFPSFILDELTGAKRWDIVIAYIFLLIGVAFIFRIVRLCLTVFINMSINQCDMYNGIAYAKHFLDIDYEKLEDGSVRDLQQRISQNVRANSFIYEDMGKLLTGLLQLGGYSWLIFSLHPLILAIVFMVVFLNYFLSIREEKNQYVIQPMKASAERKFEYFFHTMIDFGFAKEVRINQVAGWLSGKFEEEIKDYTKGRKGYLKKQALIKSASVLVNFIQMLSMYGYAAWQAVLGRITIGNFSIYVGAVLNFSSAFVSFAEGIAHMAFLSRYVEEYKAYIKLASPSHKEKSRDRLSCIPKNHTIEFRNVSFRYPYTDRMILKNVSITIHDGEKLAVVGRNGTGKSTFIKLLCRLYEPTEGTILYNGMDISAIDYSDYVRLLAVVFQDFQLFAFSIKDNIILNQEYDREKAVDALRKSGLVDKLANLFQGLETPVGKEFDEKGIEFSGGEGQKLVTARAYYKDAPIVILDEPTSALDPVSENNVYLHFNQIMKNKTAIFISHRLASTRFCDRIAVFSDGGIAEYGTHEELIEKNGLYWDMYRKQAEYYREAENG